jgi:prepilin-type processing-associated H-X9-DG protein
VTNGILGPGPEGFWQYHLGGYIYEGSATGFTMIGQVFSRTGITCAEKIRSPTVKTNTWSVFGMNWCLGPNQNRSYWRSINRFRSTSETISISEGGVVQSGATAGQCISQLDGTWLNTPGNWHGSGNNILWLDGHVSFWSNVTLLNQAPYLNGQAQDAWAPGFDPWQP